jgi:KDO2-lipid IV(A) lauroyltransferase
MTSMAKPVLKTIKYQSRDLVATLFLTLFVWIFRYVSLRSLGVMAKPLGSLGFHLVKRYRHRVTDNLRIAFGREKSLQEIDHLAREVFFHLACIPLEFIYLLAHAHRWKQFLPHIRIQGRENLDHALSKGNGVIALGLHLGAFLLLVSRLAVEGYPCNVVINRGHFPGLWKRFESYHRIFGARSIYARPTVMALKKSLNCLRRNEILYALADEQQRRRGIPTTFFGRKAFTSSGPAILSIKTRAPIIPMFVRRDLGMEKTLIICNSIEIEKTTDKEKDVELLTSRLTEAIEEIVRQYPGQWSWLNRRWKLPRPPGVEGADSRFAAREYV